MLALAAVVGPVQAQSQAWVHTGAQAVAAYERADPVPGGRALGEVRVVQPILHLHAGAWRRIRLTGTLNFEGLTIPDGELAPGNWGEGFVDRRHPHSYVHELMVAVGDVGGGPGRALALTVSAGKGFAPFGTDDPMVRPFLRYPVNHHLAQILERAVAIGAVRAGPVTAEAGLFNGDEPERPGQWPRIGRRFGDSWSGRVTAAVAPGASLQASAARVHSPEHRPGSGTDQHKWSLSARWQRPLGGHPVYALAEWARTSEAGGFFVFHTVLAEGAWTAGVHRLQLRFERTARPEEERVSDFRSRRPHLENAILGITRWTTGTVGYEVVAIRRPAFAVRPLAEVTVGRIATVGGGLVDVRGLYGGSTFWTLSLGFRATAGSPMARMGHYGAAAAGAEQAMTDHMGEGMAW